MREIPLSSGRAVSLVDDADFERAMIGGAWQLQETKQGRSHTYRYGTRKLGRTNQMLHRIIMCAPTGLVVDHVNGDGLDNRRANLRICTHAQNMANRAKHTESSSEFLGVYWHKAGRKWVAEIAGTHIGMFGCERDAARAYDRAAVIRHREFARLNFPHEDVPV